MQYTKYQRLKQLGEGAYGKAFLVQNVDDGSLWVQKQIDIQVMTEKEKAETVKEAKVLQALQHPNIIKFQDVYQSTIGKLCIIMEYADGEDLGKAIKNQNGKPFPENQILDWFTQICLALKHVHDRKILHRDLKCQNIFLTKNRRIKLGDFGIARILAHTLDNAKTQIGTPYYLSPEIIESKPYSYASDIWSVGVILYEMCMLKPPFEADSLHFLCLKICKGSFSQLSPMYSKELNVLVQKLLQTNPLRRPTINQILKMPIIVKRIKEFLSESVQQVEFAHTVLHQYKLKIEPNINELKILNDEIPRPPVIGKSGPISSNPPPQIKATNSTPNNIQKQPQKPAQNQVQKPLPSKRDRSNTPQKNNNVPPQKKNNIVVSKNNPITKLARNNSKQKVQPKPQLVHIVSSPQLQHKQPIKPQQQQEKKIIQSFENLEVYDDGEDEVGMDYGIVFEKQEEKNAVEDANICVKMKEALDEKVDIDEQFELKKKQIMENESKGDLRVEDEDTEGELKQQEIIDSSSLSFFCKTDGAIQLKTYLEQALGTEKTEKACKILLNELNSKSLEEVEEHGKNNYQKLLPFLSVYELKNFVPLIFQLIVLTR